MRSIFFVFVFCFIAITIYGQRIDASASPKRINKKFDRWNAGKAMLKSGESIQGQLSYSPLVRGGLIKIKDGEELKTFGPTLITEFSFFDSKEKKERKFVAMKMSNFPIFLEILHEDKPFSILGEETVEKQTYYYEYGTSTSYIKRRYKKYLAAVNSGSIYPLSKKSLLVLTGDKEKEIKAYIKNHKIRLRTTEDYVKVFEHYKELQLQKSLNLP